MHLTRGDKILIALLVLVNAFLFTRLGAGTRAGDWVVIEVEEREVARWPLAVDRRGEVEGPLGPTGVEVKDRRARIFRSPCRNKVCIKTGFIAYADRLAACLPNRVVVRIEGAAQRGVDAVVG